MALRRTWCWVLSFDDEKSQNKLLGCAKHLLYSDESVWAPESIIWPDRRLYQSHPSDGLVRQHGVGLLGATNGPLKNHCYDRWYLGIRWFQFKMMSERMGRPYFWVIQTNHQLLLRQPDGTCGILNPMAENIENLPGGYNYYYAMLGGEEQKTRHMWKATLDLDGSSIPLSPTRARASSDQFNVPAGAPPIYPSTSVVHQRV